MIALALLASLAAAVQLPAADIAPPAVPFAEQVVPEPVLADQRGGIRLPNGIDVTLSIDTVTALDGKIVLQTVTKIIDGPATTTAYAPEDGVSVALPGGAGSGSGTAASQPRVTYDRQNGLTITGVTQMPVNIATAGAGEAGQVAAGPPAARPDPIRDDCKRYSASARRWCQTGCRTAGIGHRHRAPDRQCSRLCDRQ